MKCCEYGSKLLQESALFIYTLFVKLLHLGMSMFHLVVACCHFVTLPFVTLSVDYLHSGPTHNKLSWLNASVRVIATFKQ